MAAAIPGFPARSSRIVGSNGSKGGMMALTSAISVETCSHWRTKCSVDGLAWPQRQWVTNLI